MKLRIGIVMMIGASAIVGGCYASGHAGTNYEGIQIQKGYERYDGEVISAHYNDVEVTSSGILLKPGARFAIKTPYVTQFIAQYEAQILSGEGMTMYLRKAASDFNPSEGTAITYSTQGCSLRLPNGKTVQLKHNAELDQQMLTLTNEAGLLGVQVGCSKLYEGYTDTPGTEYVIFETLPGSTVELRSVNYFESTAN